MRVQAVAKPARHEMPGNVAMRDLRQRMHAGVGAAGAINANLLAADRLDRVLQRALHRSAIVLDLPAAERRAVIFDDQFVAGHQVNRAGGFSGVPRKNSSAFIGALPARCSSRIRIAPSLAGDRKMIVEHFAGLARSIGHRAAQDFHAHWLALDLHLAPGAGKRRQPVNMAQHFARRPVPVDPRLGLFDFCGVGHALGRLVLSAAACRVPARPSRAPSGRRRAAPAHRAHRPRSSHP